MLPAAAGSGSLFRFLVPFLLNFQGMAFYIDCDMLVQADIKELFDVAMKNQEKAIHVVKHDYETKNDTVSPERRMSIPNIY